MLHNLKVFYFYKKLLVSGSVYEKYFFQKVCAEEVNVAGM